MSDSTAVPSIAPEPFARRRAPWDRFWLLILIVPGLLIFPNLDASILWQDEAETALLGRRIAEYGYPLADDGRPPLDPTGHSVFAISDQKDFVDLNADGIWIWTSWLGNYVTAASFIVFGWLGLPQSTLAARLPFALVGWIVLAVMYVALRDITRDRALSRLAVVLLMFSVPYLLFTRQSRNYTMLALFTLLQVWGFIRLLRGRRHALLMFVVGGVGAYYSFFVQMVGATAAMAVYVLLRHRRWAILWRFAWGCACIAALTAPFFIYTRSWDRNYEGSGFPIQDPWRLIASLRAYVLHVQLSCWPFIPLLIALAWMTPRSSRRRRLAVGLGGTAYLLTVLWALVTGAGAVSFTILLAAGGLAGVVMLVTFARTPGRTAVVWPNGESVNWRFIVAIVLACSTLAAASLANHPFFRYVMGLTPWFALMTALGLMALTRRRLRLLVPIVAVLLGTELIQFGPLYAARVLVLDPQRTRLADEFSHDDQPGRAMAYLALNRFGHQPANGYSWTMLYNDARQGAGPRVGAFEFPLYEYFYELTHDYEGPIESVIKYLNDHAQPGDTVATVYEHFPLKFYTSLPIFRYRETYNRLWDLPDWIVRQHQQYGDTLHPRIKQNRYDMIDDIPGHPCLLQWDNIPEPPWHQFRTVTGRDALKLWRLKDQFKSRPATRKIPTVLTVP